MSQSGETKKEPIPEYGDLITAEDYINCVENGFFIDYDGDGRPATATEMATGIVVYPSNLTEDRKLFAPYGPWTHVVWFNK